MGCKDTNKKIRSDVNARAIGFGMTGIFAAVTSVIVYFVIPLTTLSVMLKKIIKMKFLTKNR